MRTVLRWPPLLAAGVAVLLLAGTYQADEPVKKPKAKVKSQDAAIRAALRDVINKGADLFNPPNRDHAGCARLYQGALMAVRPLLKGHASLQKAVDQGLAEAETIPAPADRAFALRKVLDQVRAGLAGHKAPSKGGEKKTEEKKKIEEKKTEEKKTTKQTLWQRLGGEARVTKVVHDFVKTAAADPKLDFTRGGKYKVDAPKLERDLVDIISQHTGGPLHYTGPNMKEAHKGMHISNKEFDRAVEHFRRALKKNGVPRDAAADVLRIVDSTRTAIVQPAAQKKTEEKEGPLEKKTEEKKGSLKVEAPKGDQASVSGIISYKGKALPGGSVSFTNAAGKTYGSRIAADGSYHIKGPMPPGAYKVTLETASAKPAVKGPPKDAKEVTPPKGTQPPAARYVPIPQQYANVDTTSLTVTLRKGNNVFDIQLQ
jgi:hemoglobin